MMTTPLLVSGQLIHPLSRLIQKEYNKLALAFSQVHPEFRAIKSIEGTGGKASAADLIAYQIGWGRLFIGWYEAGLNGEMPMMPGEGFSTWDYVGLARHFYQKHSYGPGQGQAFYRVVLRILEIVEKEYQTGNLEKAGVWPWCTLPSGKQWPLSKWAAVNAASPYKKAAALIRKFNPNDQSQKATKP